MTRRVIEVDIKDYDDHDQKSNSFLRYFYKPCDGGTLWGYNKKTLSFREFSEVPVATNLGKKPNDMLIHTQQTREAEEDEENNVEL